MPTVTDLDVSTGLDAGEGVAIPRVTVTGARISDGAGGLAQGLVEFDAGQIEVAPGIGGPSGVFENPVVARVYQGVMDTVSLPDCNLAFAAAFTYTVTLRLEAFGVTSFSSVVISKTRFPSGTCDLSQLV